MQADIFKARVSRIADLTHNVREVWLRLVEPARLQFLPGQFISFHVDVPGSRFGVTRAYTIASPPESDAELLVLLDRVPDGKGSGYLFGLGPEDDTQFRAPFGSFTLEEGTRDLLFVASGTGIAPFRSMLWWLAAHQPDRPTTLIWGLQGEHDIYYEDELRQLGDRMPYLRTLITLSDPLSASTRLTGPVAPLVDKQVAAVDDRLEVFVCGSSAMIAGVVAVIRAKGACPIHKEPYFAATT